MTTSYVLAGGCFWCLDAVYRGVRGVSDVVSGYTGGDTENPDYRSVCTGTTGHAEAVRIDFDENVIPGDVVLDMFFTLHDPRQLNRQGNDIGTQYRSAMFPADESQREKFAAALERADELWGGSTVTTIEPLGTWWEAEDYHQDYFAKNPGNGYCQAVAVPKVRKVRAGFAEWMQ
ncbi:peptide-methionine (S)-S-oxide reductase [Gulosibacter macacae]|uniref:Peptide methionine sulfoxide reductase MsrA n=1 Tax=Gulosibacter macacae TaxID=2488791 RepID=A0A3P3VWP0_9MICO|nr:peptide-methionine (S)-S-oxide reductase MsrA [Gulosibacter macacae]RRJ85869.1 peptide-methionine (S)-S-oxide reductase [Gulosibacter macacae]